MVLVFVIKWIFSLNETLIVVKFITINVKRFVVDGNGKMSWQGGLNCSNFLIISSIFPSLIFGIVNIFH